MAAPTVAQKPTAYVTEIPGRFAPPSIVDRRNMATLVADTIATSRNARLPRAETLNMDFQTPTQTVDELGTNYSVGEYDQLAESKVSLTNYDVGCNVLSLITGKAAVVGTTIYTPNDLSTAEVDLITQYADPNGNVFYSEYMGDLVIDGYGSTLKAKSAAMEDFSLVGFNQLGFRGFFVTKAYIIQAADVTAKTFELAATTAPVIDVNNEAPVGLPVPAGGAPPSYWIQRGSLNFVKIEKWNATSGWTRFKEVSSAGSVASGFVYYAGGVNMTVNFQAGDFLAGDVVYVTYATYGTGVAAYKTIPQTTLDTSDAIAVDTRLCQVGIAAGNFSRGQQFDLKISLKRDRAEGIGDLDGLWGPPQQPQVTLGLDVKLTGANLDTLLKNGSAFGTDGGGTVAADFVDPNYMTRVMLNTPTAITATVSDPRNVANVLKRVVSQNAVFKQRTVAAQAKSAVTLKYSGSDTVGNIQIKA